MISLPRPFFLRSTQFLTHNFFSHFKYSTATVTMADRIHRITMFKLPNPEHQEAMIEQYKALKDNNQKDGKPYILSLAVGPAEADPRSQGYTLVSKTEFASLEDMKYYDEECPGHQAVKAFIKTLTVEGIMTVYFKPKVIGGSSL